MGGLCVGVGDGEVAAQHLHVFVAHEVLERVEVAALAQHVEGEGAAKGVGLAVRHAG